MGSSKKQTVGYKYFLGSHMGIVHGPIDKFTRIRVDEKVAWEGESTGGQITIDAPELFGGEEREGGISGLVDFEMGEPTQTVNDYLLANQPVEGETIPAYRGVAAAVLRQVYMGNNPYLKAWEFRGQRIHTSTRGAVQWYDDTSEIIDRSIESRSFYEDFSTYPDNWTLESGSMSAFTVSGEVLTATPVTVGIPSDSIFKSFSDISVYRLKADIKAISINSDDCPIIRLRGAGGSDLFGVIPVRQSDGYPLRNFWIHSSVYDSVGIAVTTSQIIVGDWYTIDIIFTGSQLTATLTKDGEIVSEVTGTNWLQNEVISQISIETQNAAGGGGTGSFDNIELYIQIPNGDMNPAHIIRECLTDTNWGLGYTAADIDDTAFTDAADTLFDEEFGLSLLWSKSDSIEEFIKDVIKHIDAALYVDPRTGKFVLKLIRDDYDAGTLPIFDESNIDTIDDYKKPTIGELKNYVTVKYWDRETSQDNTVSVQDIALAQQQGVVSAATISMVGITNSTLASRVASREMAALSNPIITCTIITNREGASLNIGDAFKLSWPKYGLTETIMRVANISFGTLDNGKVKIECAQDVFGLPQATFSEPTTSSWTIPTTAPNNAPYKIVQEADYWSLIQDQGESFVIDELDGYLATAAVRPSSDSINYRFWTDESGDYVEKESADFCPTAVLSGALLKAVDGVIQTTVNISSGVDLDDVSAGSICQINNENMEVISFTAVTETSGVLVVGRAVTDTAIADHEAGSRIFFWGDDFYGAGSTLYQDGDSINVKITPITPQGQLDVTLADALPLSFSQRAFRAYPPGNVKLDSIYFPAYIENATEFTATWADRDRTLQTAGLDDFTTGNIGPEVGVTYTAIVTRVDTGATLDSSTGLATTTDTLVTDFDGVVLFDIKSARDSLDSFYSQSHQFVISRTGVLTTEQNEIIYDESGDPIFTES